jgi:hypothetical protein
MAITKLPLEGCDCSFHAQFVTRSILDHEIGRTDIDSPMTGARADELRQLVKARVLVYPGVALRIGPPPKGEAAEAPQVASWAVRYDIQRGRELN